MADTNPQFIRLGLRKRGRSTRPEDALGSFTGDLCRGGEHAAGGGAGISRQIRQQ